VPINSPVPEEQLVAIVDDDASVRLSASRLIRSLGYRAEAFGSADEFLGSGRATGTGCLILDVRMPNVDGLELQRRLVASELSIPIVFITARASDDEERRALRAGAVAFMRKPVDRETLVRVLAEVLDRSTRDRGGPNDDGSH